MRSLAASLAASAFFAAGEAVAQTPPHPKIDEIIVTAPRDPKVTATYPANGGVTPAGAEILKIVFDQAMTPEAWSYSRVAAEDFPSCLATPRLLGDKRTFVLLCSLAAGRAYALQINAAPGFVSAAGREVKPFVLRFSTTEADATGLHYALTRAGLTDADDPIMTWDGASGVSTKTPPQLDPAAP